MIMLKRLMVAASLALGASGAYAQHAQEAGWYGGIDVGGSHLSGINTDSLDSFDKSDTAFDVNLGYRLNRNFAVEGAYTDLGKFHFSSAALGDGDVKPTAVSLSAVGILPLQSSFSLYGKAGAGVMYDFNRNVYAKAGWDHFDDVGNDAVGKGHADLYSLGVGYRF